MKVVMARWRRQRNGGHGRCDSWVNGWRKCEEEWRNMVEGSIIDRERSEYFGLMMAGVNIFKMPKFSIFLM